MRKLKTFNTVPKVAVSGLQKLFGDDQKVKETKTSIKEEKDSEKVE